MNLSSKARCLLEISYFLGTDFLESVLSPKSTILSSAYESSERARDRMIKSLQSKGYLATKTESNSNWIPEITSLGRTALFDDLNPDTEWSSSWDGIWRAISFDLPQTARPERHQLKSWLSKRRFGNLQGSLWITHRPYKNWTEEIQRFSILPHHIQFFELNPIGQSSPADYVSSTWSYERINRYYSEYIDTLDRASPENFRDDSLQSWMANESKIWKRAFVADPFLPDSLLPAGYKGKEAWSKRRNFFREVFVHSQDTA